LWSPSGGGQVGPTAQPGGGQRASSALATTAMIPLISLLYVLLGIVGLNAILLLVIATLLVIGLMRK
jgi:hypothetical protein